MTVPQLRAIGLDRIATRRLVTRGSLFPIRRGLYSLARSPRTFVWRAAVACTHPAQPSLSGLSAAHCWGMWSEPERIEVTVRYPANVEIQDTTVHRSADIRAQDITRLQNLPVTTPTRTLVDLGRVLPECEVSRVLDHAVATGLVTPGRLLQMRIEVGEHGRNGAGVLGRLLDDLPNDPEIHESGPELALRRLLLEMDLPEPEAQWPVRVGHTTYRLDLAYPDAMVAFEYDGHQHHHTDAQFAADARRQDQCESVGWSFLRLTKSDLTGLHRLRTIATIRQTLERRYTNPAA